MTDISWKDYMMVVAISAAIYYLFVGLRYFSPELKALVSPSRGSGGTFGIPDRHAVEILPEEEEPQDRIASIETFTNDDLAEVEALIERLKQAISCSPADKVEKPELEHCLRLMFSEYPGIRNSPLRFSINELAATECEKYGTAPLSQDEVEMLWKEAER